MRMLALASLWGCILAVSLGAQVVSNARESDFFPQTSPWRAQFRSQRIEALRREIASGRRSTESFWEDVQKVGTPLLEPSQPDHQHQLVTFVWRGTQDTQSVLVVVVPFTHVFPRDYLMTRVDDTDVWYVTVRFPRGARIAYRVVVNDTLDMLAFVQPQSGFGPSQRDPLNPRRWLGGQSLVELPGAAPQLWIMARPEVPRGEIIRNRLRSVLTNNERSVWVYTPPGYRPNRVPYPLLVLLDGQAQLTDVMPTRVILDNLIAASRIPPVVGVFIENFTGTDRNKELQPDSKFPQFLASELIPWVREHFHVTKDPRRTIIGGQSAGGFMAALAGLRHPEVFGNVLAQSGAFWYSPALLRDRDTRRPADGSESDRHNLEENEDRATVEGNWLATEFIKSRKLQLRFYMDAGLFEIDFLGQGGDILESTRHLRDVLRAKGYEVHYQQFVGGHDYVNWRGTFGDALIALIGTK